jgi:hypothetical protein
MDSGSPFDVKGRQIAAGRALLRWSLADLAARAGVCITTLHSLENDGNARLSSARAVVAALESHGVRLVPPCGAVFQEDSK